MTRSIPGLRGIDHIGFTVPDMEQATRFFVDVMGCEQFFDSGPLSADDDMMERKLNVHPRTVVKRMRHLRCGHGSNIELFEYEAPERSLVQPRNSDVGGHHLAFYSDDFDKTLEWLRDHGVRILGEPGIVQKGPNARTRWVYFLTPWGMQLELVSTPDGRAYEETTDRRLWNPTDPAS